MMESTRDEAPAPVPEAESARPARFGNGRGGPKKLRGDAARIQKLAGVAREAAEAALKAEAQRRTLLRVIAHLARTYGGGRLEILFSEVAKEPEATMGAGGEGTPGACLIVSVPPVRIADRVRVVKWRAWDPKLQVQPRENAVEVSWPGRVIGIANTHARVRLDPGEDGSPHQEVDVWIDWLEPDASTRVDTLAAHEGPLTDEQLAELLTEQHHTPTPFDGEADEG